MGLLTAAWPSPSSLGHWVPCHCKVRSHVPVCATMLGRQVRCCPPACLRPTERPNVWLVQGRVAGQAVPAGAGWYTPHWYRGWDWLRMCGVCCCLHCLAAAWAGGCWLENWKPINTPSPQRSSQPPPPPPPDLSAGQWSPWLPCLVAAQEFVMFCCCPVSISWAGWHHTLTRHTHCCILHSNTPPTAPTAHQQLSVNRQQSTSVLFLTWGVDI